jgi:hypothetical protein
LKFFDGGAILATWNRFRSENASFVELSSERRKEAAMSLLQIFFRSTTPSANAGEGDPLQHPDLAAMSLLELADLPLMPENLGRVEVAPHPACRPPSPRLRGEGDRRTCHRP